MFLNIFVLFARALFDFRNKVLVFPAGASVEFAMIRKNDLEGVAQRLLQDRCHPLLFVCCEPALHNKPCLNLMR